MLMEDDTIDLEQILDDDYEERKYMTQQDIHRVLPIVSLFYL